MFKIVAVVLFLVACIIVSGVSFYGAAFADIPNELRWRLVSSGIGCLFPAILLAVVLRKER